MKQFEAQRINWPLWVWYLMKNWRDVVLYSRQEVIDKYSIRLLEILEKDWVYKSPKQHQDQLYLFVDEYENMI